jgi:DNA-binding NtrC family response regulator
MLKSRERTFFRLLVETVYANPFDSDQGRIARLAGHEGSTPAVSQANRYGELMPALERHIASLDARGLERIERFSGDDPALMRLVYLFHGYQRSIPSFDALIAHQTRDRPGRSDLDWTRDLLATLEGRGFAPAEASRTIALYYQVRRAYYFIERNLVGRSAPMAELRRALWDSVFTCDLATYAACLWGRMQDFSTLLLGETGTGKGSAAAAIGRSGPIAYDAQRASFTSGIEATFTATNLSEFPEGLIESELFGHRKGAFTGAVEHHEGLFARCQDQGTLFLDEIGDVSLPVQTKLLRVLQERTFAPVGSHEPRHFGGRVLAATNRPLEALIADRGFRRDLFYRLAGNIIRVPCLRERLADSPQELVELVDALLARVLGGEEALGGPRERVLEALAALPSDYAWPGNVRELEQAVRRILISGRYRPDAAAPAPGPDPWLAAVEAGRLDAQGLLGGYCRRLVERHGTIEAAARIIGLDRRTVKRHSNAAHAANDNLCSGSNPEGKLAV